MPSWHAICPHRPVEHLYPHNELEVEHNHFHDLCPVAFVNLGSSRSSVFHCSSFIWWWYLSTLLLSTLWMQKGLEQHSIILRQTWGFSLPVWKFGSFCLASSCWLSHQIFQLHHRSWWCPHQRGWLGFMGNLFLHPLLASLPPSDWKTVWKKSSAFYLW